MKKRVSVVVLNFNGAEMLRRFLPSVLSYSDEAEVIVADNASSDESAKIIADEFPTVRFIQLSKNYGFAEGYNMALSEVDSEYYLLLNSDVEVTNDWISPMLSYMDTHNDVAVCQPKIRSFKDRVSFEYAGAAGGYIDYCGYPFCRGRIFDMVEADYGQYDCMMELFWATGAAFMIRKVDFWNAGGFDGTFFAHMEEIDLCWRLRARGRRIVCIPDSVVYHVGGATLDKSNPRKTFLNFRNNLLLLYKNLPEQELYNVMFLRAVLDYIAAMKFLLSGRFSDFKAVVKARREFGKIKKLYFPKRRENLEKSVCSFIPERTSYSILWQYYFRRHKKFNELPE